MCENQHPQYKFDFRLSPKEKNALRDILEAYFRRDPVWRCDDHYIEKVEQTLAMVKEKDKTMAKA